MKLSSVIINIKKYNKIYQSLWTQFNYITYSLVTSHGPINCSSVTSHLMDNCTCFVYHSISWTAVMTGIFSLNFWVNATRTVITWAAGPLNRTLTTKPSICWSSSIPPPVPARYGLISPRTWKEKKKKKINAKNHVQECRTSPVNVCSVIWAYL